MEEPLEAEETGHRDGDDELAEWVHGHPTQLWEEDRAREGRGKEKRERKLMSRFLLSFYSFFPLFFLLKLLF